MVEKAINIETEASLQPSSKIKKINANKYSKNYWLAKKNKTNRDHH